MAIETVSFNFIVSGSVCQHLEIIKEGLTGEELIAGLKCGVYITTIGEGREVISTNDWTVVAKVVCNEILDDMEYSDFDNE